MMSSAQPPILLHEGNQSRIYYQPESEYKRPVVIKILKAKTPPARELIQLNNEYEFTKDLAIKGVRNSITRLKVEGKPALVLEYIPGQSIKQAFVERRQSLIDFLKVGIQIAQTLGELHMQHIIHRDINSSNILVNLKTPTVKVIDFGLASRLDLQIEHLGNPEGLAYTLAYISPEQTGRMNRMVDFRTDLYSLGVTFYEMLSGRVPFLSDDPLALVHAHMAKAPQPLSAYDRDIPPIISDIVMRLLAKNAEDRYQSAFGLKADLERCLSFLQSPKTRKKPEGLSFKLGSDDYSGQLHIPQKLYGRGTEIATLMAAFDRAAAGGRELMLVAGYAGVGKTALVAEVHKPITEKRGYFISGKFDQYQRNTPYTALSHAFNQFAELLLTESEKSLTRWRETILSAVGGNGAVLTELMPGLEKVIGVQPEVTELSGNENRNRFNLSFQNFVQAIGTAEHPLVVFIDDCQWADLASLELLRVLLSDEKTGYVLLICAYRDNEVDQAHPLMISFRELIVSGVAIKTIGLGNLGKADVRRLLQESLSATDTDSLALTELIYEKTRGNAFFTRQLLQNLYEENWLRFDFSARRWVWDIAQLKGRGITDNVVDLMSVRLSKLSPETAGLLQLAACIGNEFDLETLSLISRESIPGTLEMLIEAINQGLIIPQDDYYQLSETATQAHFHFLHDRVQQAAYAQISAEERQNVHLKIGRRLLADIPADELEKRVFDVLNHYNQALSLITNETERLRVVGLNITAAESAFRAAAFQSAKFYLETTLPLMPADAWTSRYETMLKLHSLLATALSLIGDTERLDQVYHITEDRTRTMADTAAVKMAKIQSLLFHGNYADAIEIGLAFVQGMGIPINRNPSPDESIRYLQETADWLTPSRIETLNRLPDAPHDIALVMEVALVINGATFNSDINFHLYFVSQIARLCIEKGLSPWAPVTLMTFTSDLSAALHDIPKTRLLADKILQLFEERYRTDNPVAPLSLLMGGFVTHRYEHLKHTLPIFVEGVQKGLLTGSFQFGGYCAWWQAWHQLFLGDPLSKAEAASLQAKETCRKMQLGRMVDWCSLIHQVVLNLQGRSEVPWILKGDAYDEQEKLALALELNDLADEFRIYFYKGWLNFLFGRQREAVEYFRKTESYSLYGSGHYILPMFYLYDTLSHAAISDQEAPEERLKILKRITHNIEEIEVWARFAPMNYQHQKDLMEAEKARIEGRHAEAEALYEKAIQGARENDFIHIEALSYERAAEFHLSQGKEDASRLHTIKAHECYSRWQAWAKVRDLERRHPQWFIKPEPVSMKESAADLQVELKSLDLRSVMKATQAISGEIVLEELLRKLMEIVIENAGAQRGCLILERDGKWLIEAEGAANQKEVRILQGIDLEMSDELSRSIVRFVARSHEGVVLDDAAREGLFVDDPYIKHNRIKSVLCTPLLNRGRLNGILYLENNLTTDAFTSENIEVLEMLAGQAAIALENATLYQQSQQEIAERRQAEEALRESRELLSESNRELESTNEELQAAMEELEATNDALLDSSNELAAVNQRLAESEANYRTIIENMQDAFYRSSLDGKLIMASPSFARLFGYDALEECLGKKIAPNFYANPADRQILIEKINANGRVSDYEVKLRRRDGTVVYATTSSQFFYDSDGAIAGIEGVLRDITRRKLAEEQREAALEALRQANIVVENSPAILFRWRAAEGWPVELVSKNIVQFGYTAEDLMSGTIAYASIVHPEDLERIADELREYSESGIESFQQTYRIITRNGEARWVEDRSIMERDTDGHVTFYQGIVIDITERKKVEENLRESEERFRLFMEHFPGLAYIKDSNGTTLFANEGFKTILDIPTSEMIGRSNHDLFPPEFAEKITNDDRTLLESGESREIEEQFAERTWSTYKFVLPQPDGPPLLGGLTLDITEHKKAEDAMLREKAFSDTVINSLPVTFFLFNERRELQRWNNSFLEQSGYSEEELIGISMLDFIPEENHASVTGILEKAYSKGHADFETYALKKGGAQTPYHFSISRLLVDGKQYILGAGIDITEQKLSEQALLREKSFSDTVINSLPTSFFLFNDRGELIRWNESHREQSGYSDEELKGMHITGFFPEEFRESVLRNMHKVIEEGHGEFETLTLCKDGKKKPYHFSISRMTVEGKPYILGSGLDITERKLAQAQLERNLRETMLRFEISQALAGMENEDQVLDVLMRQAGLHPEAHAAIFTLDKGEEELTAILRRDNPSESDIETIVPLGSRIPVSRHSVLKFFSAGSPFISPDVFADERIDPVSLEIIRRSGASSLAAFCMAAGKEEMGYIIALSKQTGYFNEEKQHLYRTLAELGAAALHAARLRQTIREGEQRLNDIFQGSPIPAFIINAQHQVIHWNRALEEISGIKSEEVMGNSRHWRAFYDQERPCMADLLMDGRANMVDSWYQGKYRKSDLLEDAYEATDFFPNLGEEGRWLRFTAAVIRDPSGTPLGALETLEDISERMLAEEALRASEKKYRSVIENIQDVFLRVDLDGMVLMCSPSGVKTFGYDSIDEIIGLPVEALWADPQERRRLRAKLDETGVMSDYEAVWKKKDGTHYYVSMTLRLYHDDYGNVLGTEGIIRDITERKRAEEALQESEEKYRSLVENALAGIFAVDDSYHFVYINDKMCQLLQYAKEELIGLDFRKVLSDESLALVTDRYVRRQRGEQVQPVYEMIIVRKDGQLRHVEMSVAVVKNIAGKIHTMGLLVDITERKRAEEELQKLAAVVMHSNELVNIATFDGKMIFLNEAGSRMLGIAPDEVAGTNILQVIPDPLLEKVKKEILPLIKEGGYWEGDLQYRNLKTGAMTDVRANVFTISDPKTGIPLYLVNVSLDITERRRAEESLRESEATIRSVFLAAPVGIGILKNRIQTNVNKYWCDRFGYTEEEIIGNSTRMLYESDEEFNRAGQELYDDLKEKGISSAETRMIGKDGTTRDVLLTTALIRQDDISAGVIGIIYDITERKRMDDALREKTEELERYFTNALDLLCIADMDGYFRKLNKEWEDLLGYSIQELEGRKFLDFVHPDDMQSTLDAVSRLESRKEVLGFVNRYRAKDGSYRWLEWRSTPVGDLIYAVARDITERIQAEEALRESEERFRAIFNSVNDSLFVHDPDTGDILDVNQVMCDKFGYTRAEALQKNVGQLSSGELRYTQQDALMWIKKALEEGPQLIEWEAKDSSGRLFWMEGNMRRAVIGGHDRIIMAARDITERKRLEEALEKRIVALTRPLDSAEEVAFEELFNLDEIQRLQDLFSATFGVAGLITSPDGTPITKPSNFGRLCSEFIRNDPKGMANCIYSDSMIGRTNPDGPNIGTCLSAGLCNAGASITVGGRHIANWLIGQVRNESQKEEEIMAYARELGADEDGFRRAYREVPVMSQVQFERLAHLLFAMATQLSASAYQNVQQARFIAERKRAEEALRESEERFRSLVETTSDCVWETDEHGILTYLSPKIIDLLGYKPEDGIGKSPLIIMPPDEAARLGPILSDHMRNKRPIERLEHLSQHRDGRVLVLETSGVPFFDTSGKLLGYRGIDRDITERKAAEEALRESAERYRMLVSTSMDGFVVVDKDGRLADANEAYCKATGYTRDELIGMAIVDLEAKDDPEVVMERTARIINTGSELFETQHRRKDGTIIDIEVNITLIPTTGQMLAFLRDITERKRAEVALRESEWRYRILSDYYHHLNSIFISFAEARSMEDLYRIIAELYRQFTGARGVALLQYNYNDSSFTVASLSGDEKDIAATESVFGVGLMDLHIPVGDELKEIMINEVIKRSDSLSTVTGGAIPQEISDRILEAMDCREVICLAIYHGAELVGTVNAFMHEKEASLPLDTLRTFGQMAGLSIIRKRTEEEINRLNMELEQKVAQRTRELKGAYDELVKEVEERKAAEEALRQSKNHLNLITNNMLDLVSIIGRDYTFTYVSPSHKTVLGYDPDEYLGKSVLDFVSRNDREKTAAVIDSILSTGLTGSTLNRFRNADGHLQWVETFGSVLHDDAGEAIGVITSGRDITDRYLLERQLKLSERRFRGLFENSPVSLFELDLSKPKSYLDELRASGLDDLETYLEGNPEAIEQCIMLTKLINVNSTARGIFKIERKGIILDEYPNIIRQCIDTFREGLIVLSQGSRSFGEEITIEVGSERTMHLSFRISLAPGAEENWSRAIASVEDITRFKEMERDLKLARDSAEKANRAKSEFLANMSHELRTPLNAIIGFSQIIDMQLQEKSIEKLTEYLGYIKTSGEHLLDMVNDILDLSKIEAGKIELDIKQFNLKDTLISIPTHVKSLAMKKGLQVHLDLAPDLGIIRGDEVRIKQIIYNLLSNAIKFTESGKHIGIRARREGNTAVITVWDEGIGIDAQNIARIFQPFEQVGAASKDAQGTGLGLAITMRLVQLHGGGIKVESSPGGGSKFTITLPGAFAVEAESGRREPAPGRPHPKPLGRPRRILVVDDNKTNLRLLEEFLKTVGFEVEAMRSGEEAVDRLAHADFDLILMDIKMPGIGGIEAMKAIRSMNRKNLKIFAFTASAMKGSEESLLKMGFDDYISKPVDLSGLLTRIKKSLGEE